MDISQFFQENKTYILITISVICLLFVVYYIYTSYFKTVINDEDSEELDDDDETEPMKNFVKDFNKKVKSVKKK